MQTFGTHLTLKAGKFGASASGYLQTGKDNKGASVMAWLAAASLKYQVVAPFCLTLGEDYGSGSDGTDGKNKTFNVLYGTHHKFYGAMDYFNNSTMPKCGLSDTYLTAAVVAHPKVDLSATYHYFATGVKMEGFDRTLGSELDLQVNWKVIPYVTLQGGYSIMGATKTMEAIKGGNCSRWQDWAWVSLNVNPRIFSNKKK